MTSQTSLALGEPEDAAAEGPGANRWMVSYADFVTLLLVFFVALYALTTQHNAKLTAQVAQAKQAPPPSLTVPNLIQLEHERRRDSLLQDLRLRLQPLVAAGQLRLVKHGKGLALEIPEEALFASGEATPSARAQVVLQAVAEVLADAPYAIRVEGHTDDKPVSTVKFPSNWELSTARAAAVVRALAEHGVLSSRLSAMGLADTRPKADNQTEQGRALNRRVDLVLFDT